MTFRPSTYGNWRLLLEINIGQVDAILRSGIRQFTDMVGQLWNALADYYIRRLNFDKARDVYEEAIQTVLTVRDFTEVFDAYAQVHY